MTEPIDWTAISAALQAPFAVEDVEFKPGRGGSKALIYVDARAVQDRLDTVVGPENWAFDWTPLVIGETVQVVKGTLTIHGVSKSDIGDGEKIETSKAAVSDSLKRAAVMWGIGRYLYGLAVSSEAEYKTWLQRQGTPARRTTPTPLRTEDTTGVYTVAADPSLTTRLHSALAALGLDLEGLHAARAKANKAPWAALDATQQEQLVEHYERKAADIQGGAA